MTPEMHFLAAIIGYAIGGFFAYLIVEAITYFIKSRIKRRCEDGTPRLPK